MMRRPLIMIATVLGFTAARLAALLRPTPAAAPVPTSPHHRIRGRRDRVTVAEGKRRARKRRNRLRHKAQLKRC